MRGHIAIPLFAAVALFAAAAGATQQGQKVMGNWRSMDKCAQQAQLAYPDFTAESNAKRDAKLKDCLNAGNLPPRDPAATGSK